MRLTGPIYQRNPAGDRAKVPGPLRAALAVRRVIVSGRTEVPGTRAKYEGPLSFFFVQCMRGSKQGREWPAGASLWGCVLVLPS
jgi:hypothetical protein